MSWRSRYEPPAAVQAYRSAPTVQHQEGPGGGGGRGRGRAAAAGGGGGARGTEAPLGPEIYGFEHTVGLPGFEGGVAAATLASGPAGASAPEAHYLALLCHESLLDFQQQHIWDQQLLPAVETVLRNMALQGTPSTRELHIRLQAMGRLKELAQSGIYFCVGLDLEPYGSFVSGLYTPHGDLDLSIEGQASWRDEAGRQQRVTVDGMERDMKVKFLRALASRIQAQRVCIGQVDRILHARVPILKFRDSSGLDFDVGIGGSHALFKSTVMGLLAQYDWRFGALVRLVKLWSRHYDVNDSANGSLNSFALTLMVVFHLQTRTPAVLPPLCQLFSMEPDAERPMQEQRLPDWRLLQHACEHLSVLSAMGGCSTADTSSGRRGGSSSSRGNTETLLELLSSFFALYDGVLSGGWAAAKGADAVAMRGVLRRVRVDTWAGRLRYERWDKEGYCCSVEDPFDSTDNCARTVRREEKLGQIAAAVAAGRALLMDIQQPLEVEHCLLQLFGSAALHERHVRGTLLGNGRTQVVQWIPPVDLIIPPRIQHHTEGRLPRTVLVDHQLPRGGGSSPGDSMRQLQQQADRITLEQHQQQKQQQGTALTWPPPPPPPPGLGYPSPFPPKQQYAAPPPPLPPFMAPHHVGLAPGALLPGGGYISPAAAAATAGFGFMHNGSGGSSGGGSGGSGGFPPVQPAAPGLQQQQQAAAAPASLQQLRRLMEPEVGEEAARLAEIERKSAAAHAVVAAAREEKKAAKRAAAKAVRDAKAAEKPQRQQRAGRGRSRSNSGSRKGGTSGGGGSSGGSSRPGSRAGSRDRGAVKPRAGPSSSLTAAMQAAAAAAGVGNTSRPSSMASSGAAEVSAAAAAPVAAAEAAAPVATIVEAAFASATEAALTSAVEEATEAAAAGSAVPAGSNGSGEVGSNGSGEVGSSSDGRQKERRFGANMKAAARARQDQRSRLPTAGGSSASAAAAAVGTGPATAATAAAAAGSAAVSALLQGPSSPTLQHPPPPPQTQQQQQRVEKQEPGQPGGGAQQQQQGRGRGGGRTRGRGVPRRDGAAAAPAAAAGSAGGGTRQGRGSGGRGGAAASRVLVVQRQASGGSGPPPLV